MEKVIEIRMIIKKRKYSLNFFILMWKERWLFSTNTKYIGTLYLIFALFSGLLGTAFSVLTRVKLNGPGVQYIANNQLYNKMSNYNRLM